VAKATLKALQGLRLREQIYKARGLAFRPANKPATKTEAPSAASAAPTQS